MNYAKVLGAALQLFPKKIKVTVIHGNTGELIGIYKMDKNLLPQQFNKPVTVSVENKQWQVINAEPAKVDDYLFSKKLILYVQDADRLQAAKDRFLTPTIASSLPLLPGDTLFTDFSLTMHEQDWRQVEFLPASLLPVIHDEIKMIEPILSPVNGENLLLGFTSRHTRAKVGGQCLSVPLQDFCELVHSDGKGSVNFIDGAPLQNTFVIRSTNYTYYGLIQANAITELCLPAFDGVDDEFIEVITAFDLILVDWCNATIIMNGNKTADEDVKEINDEYSPV